ncbi:MAG: peptidyl-prolyl cis-trans isomerase, partial [Candidatus Cloacimonadaceae bacterium]|nr:peptidyl-prolyl cis-trans isomerase [Candidatus Cloacimonadaceae bacterium]
YVRNRRICGVNSGTSQNRVNDNDVLAEFRGGQILRKDLNDKISKLPPQVQGQYKTVQGQTQILEIMATEEIFYTKGLELNIQSDPAVLEKINAGKKQFYIQEYYKRNVTEPITITDKDKRDFYSENRANYFVHPYLSIYYIQVDNADKGKKALQELKDGTSFEAVSDKYNINTYAKGLKGRVKNIRLNGHIPGLGNDAVLDSLIDIASRDQGKVFGPDFTPTGWHIYQVFERVEGRQRLYEEVEAEIEQRLRPLKESQKMDEVVEALKIKYSVVVDTTLLASLDLRNRKSNSAVEGLTVVSSSEPVLRLTVKELLNQYEKMSPQEQVFYLKEGGAKRVATQELTRNLMFVDARDSRYEDFFRSDPQYVQMQRYHILQEAFKRLVLDRIDITTEDARAFYDSRIDSYTTPESRAIQILYFENEKTARTARKQFVKAARRNREKDVEKIIKKFSTKPDRSVLDNQYNNGVITGVGPDADFSRKIWELGINGVSDVFTTAKGDIVFFRVLRQNEKIVKPFTEVEPRIYGTLRKEAEKTMQELVKEELFLEYDMKKYPERIRLLLTAEELFELADNAARQRKFKDAMVYYDQIINNYANNTDDYKAYFMKAFLVTEEMNDKNAGLDLFRAFLIRYPQGELNESAQFMIDELEGRHDAIFDDGFDAE